MSKIGDFVLRVVFYLICVILGGATIAFMWAGVLARGAF